LKRFISIFIIGCLLISGLNAVANTNEDDMLVKHTHQQFAISEPQLSMKNDFLSVTIPEQTAYILEEGKPMLPLISKTFTYPIGTKINTVNVDCDLEEIILTSSIEPAPAPVALHSTFLEKYEATTPDQAVYQSSAFYPEDLYTVHIGVGLYNEEHSVIVTVKCHSRYAPASNILQVPKSIDISIDYQLPSSPVSNDNTLGMLIITDESFVDALQPLVDHKNEMGIETRMKTVQEIYPEYNGVADWEDVKLCIKDAIEMYDIEFVLLAGGHKGQTSEWFVPDFRSRNYDNNGIGEMDLTYSADLYYADVYKYSANGEPIFEDWDTNEDGVYAEGPYYRFGGYDKPDFYPDVAVGRIPLRYSWEVPIIVDKIITYERTAEDSWYKKAVFCAGDTSPYERYGDPVIHGIYEGELTCDNHAKYLEEEGFESIKLYTSLGVRGVDDVAPVISEGCGWVNMQMHANPATGGNHITDTEEFARFYSFVHMDLFQNGDKLPFMINDGCHNAQYDVTMQHVFDHGGFEDIVFSWYEWIPTDASSWFLLKEDGGAIGVIGNTALGYGYLNEYFSQGLGGWIMPRFAHAYAIQGNEYAGTVWAQGISDYITEFPVLTDDVDRKTIEERPLLGDPSLKLGGYGIGTLDNDDDDEQDPPVHTLGIVDKPDWQQGMSWTYAIDDITIDFSEIDGRDLLLQIETGEIILTVEEVSASFYRTSVSTQNLQVFVDANIDLFVEEKQPMKGTGKLVNTSITGEIIFDRTTLGINSIILTIEGALDTESILANIDFDVPSIVLRLIPEIPLTMNIEIVFEEPYVLIQYPLDIGNGWGVPEGLITLDGTVESPYFRLLKLVNRIAGIFGMELIPEFLAQYLPIIDISEILTDLGIANEMTIPEITDFFDSPSFECRTEEEVIVDAGTYTAYDIWFMVGAGELFYSPEVQNVVKIQANIDNYIPIIDNISLDLIEFSP